MPATADEYALPEIEGLSKDDWEKSPAFKTIREAAHKAGLPPAEFNEFVTDYIAKQNEEVDAIFDAEMEQLGPDKAAVKKRLTDVTGAVKRLLPAGPANALIAAATTADAVRALELLVNRSPAGKAGGDPPPVVKDDWATINSLMLSDSYAGREDQRDPKVVARVDAYFAAGGKRGGK